MRSSSMSKRRRRSVKPRCWRPGRMVDRALEGFNLAPQKLIGDTAYGAAEMLNWLVDERGIEPHIPVWDKSQRADGTFSRDDFTYDHASDTYRCPGGKTLQRYRRRFTVPRTGVMKDNSMRYRASQISRHQRKKVEM